MERRFPAALQVDSDNETVDADLPQRNGRFVLALLYKSLLPFASLNRDAVDRILETKKDVWKNPKMFQLVNDYFKNTIGTSDYFTALQASLKKARDFQRIVERASFDEENPVAVAAEEENQPPKILNELRQYFFFGGTASLSLYTSNNVQFLRN